MNAQTKVIANITITQITFALMIVSYIASAAIQYNQIGENAKAIERESANRRSYVRERNAQRVTEIKALQARVDALSREIGLARRQSAAFEERVNALRSFIDETAKESEENRRILFRFIERDRSETTPIPAFPKGPNMPLYGPEYPTERAGR